MALDALQLPFTVLLNSGAPLLGFAAVIYLSLRLLHFIFMATWLGSGLFATRDIKNSLAAGAAHIPGLRDRMNRRGRLAMISGPLTLITGFVMIFVLGGFASVPKAIHVGLLLGIVMSVIGTVGIGRAWTAMEKQLVDGASPQAVEPMVKRIAMFGGIFHALWMVTLVVMVFRNANR